MKNKSFQIKISPEKKYISKRKETVALILYFELQLFHITLCFRIREHRNVITMQRTKRPFYLHQKFLFFFQLGKLRLNVKEITQCT